MTRVMAVTFALSGRLYYVDQGAVEARVGDAVLVPVESEAEVATVMWVADAELAAVLPVCAGLAGPADIDREQRNRTLKAEATEIAKALIAGHGLPMRVVGIDLDDHSSEYGRVVAIYYTAPQRVDFRALVRDLASALSARIDLRQIGSRDAARIVGGIGTCGRDLCCSALLTDLQPVGMRLVKGQDVLANQLAGAGNVRAPEVLPRVRACDVRRLRPRRTSLGLPGGDRARPGSRRRAVRTERHRDRTVR